MNKELNSCIFFWICYYFIGILFPNNTDFKKIYKAIFINSISTIITTYIFIQFPSLEIENVLKFPLSVLITGMYFYPVHRLLHTKYLYKYHQKHHEYNKPFALAGLYCSIFEMIVLNYFSLMIPLKIFYFTQLEMFFLCFLFSFNILKGHSGLKYKNFLGSLISNEEHEIHHIYYKYNYCVLPFNILDRIFKTYKT